MPTEKESEDMKAKHPDEKIFWFVAIGFIAMVAAPGIYVFAFRNYNLGGPADWGSFATYFSGIVTPIVALCSAVLFFRSIVVQRDEFEKTRREMQASTELQFKREIHTYNLARQEQIEKTIPKVRKLQKKYFKQAREHLKKLSQSREWSADPDDKPRKVNFLNSDSERARSTFFIVTDSLHSYHNRGLHVNKLIIEYLDCDGDIYLMLDTISEILTEFSDVSKFSEQIGEEKTDEFKEYKLVLSKLVDRLSKETKEYVTKRTKEPQSA